MSKTHTHTYADIQRCLHAARSIRFTGLCRLAELEEFLTIISK